MSAEDLARQFFLNMGRRDVDGTLALIEADAEIRLAPLQQEGRGPDTMRGYLQELAHAFPDLSVRVRRLFVGSEATVAAEVRVEGVQAGDFLGIVNQEKHMEMDQAWVLHVAGAKLDRLAAYWCQNRLYRRLGVKRLDRITITG